jgi:hypothetical protein
MKTICINRKGFFSLVAGIALSVFFMSCTKDDNNSSNDRVYSTSGNASGAQQSPPVSTSGTGSISGTYNATTNNWQYMVNWNALSSTASAVEIHGPASSGVNGSLVVALTITTPGLTGSASGNVTLTEQQEAWLFAGQLYYTVLTATNITGEIRGQISASLE